jgi:hypothetical protein
MEQTTSASSFAASDFAGLLASLANPQKESALTWNEEDLGDDIATLSYEHALRTHARYRPSDADLGSASAERSATPPTLSTTVAAPRVPGISSNPEAGCSARAHRDTRKCASITIRLSESECALLRQRAAEAGLTVSAYLRSCTFEVENLRAQVKETLARLRSVPDSMPSGPIRPAVPRWWSRFWLHVRRKSRGGQTVFRS